jgi:putative ABC transport system permease protein
VEGHEPPSGVEPTQAQLQTVSPGYFRSLGMSLLGGRDFLETDQAKSPPVAIVDKTLAEKYWPDGQAAGHRIRSTGDDTWMTIVGVVNGVKDQNLAEDMKPHLYFPHGQDQELRMYLVIRTAGSPLTVVPAVRDKIRGLDPDIPVYAVRPLTDALGETLNRQKFIDGLLTMFAVLALVLAVIGIYGVISAYVTNRTREFGIRMALGAQAGDVLYLVLKQGVLLILSGIVAGLIGAFVLTKSIASLLYNVSVTDTAVFIFLPLLLLLVALTACYLPARRAARSDPSAALRYE